VDNLDWLSAVLVDGLPFEVLRLGGGALVGLIVVLARQAVEQLGVLPAQQAEQVLWQGITELHHCNGNSVYIFLFWELRGFSPNFHIHVSVSDLYIPRIGPHISSSRKGRPIVEIYNLLKDT
jgi:hypothetical protein